MVTPAGATPRPDRLRGVGFTPLNEPCPLTVDADESGVPVTVALGGRRLAVEQVLDVWRIDDEWWREEVSRLYYRLVLSDGRSVIVYCDLRRELWLEQSY